jgi:hypothetical protein
MQGDYESNVSDACVTQLCIELSTLVKIHQSMYYPSP